MWTQLKRRASDFEPRQHRRVWGWLVASLATLPVFLDLTLSDRGRPFGYLASDSFYYLTVARNWAQTGLSSFDGVHLTNGYHPLWQWLLTLLYGLNDGLGFTEASLLTSLTLLSALLVGWGLKRAADGLLAQSSSGAVYACSLLLPVGLFSLICAPFWWALGLEGVQAQSGIEGGRPLFGTAWIYMNGMESGLALLFYGGLLWRAAQGKLTDTAKSRLITGASLALLTLSRLDHGLIAGWLWLGCLAQILWGAAEPDSEGEGRARLKSSALLTAPFVIPVVIYLVYNHQTFGSALPLSGKLKSSLPQLTNSNINHLIQLLSDKPPAHWLPRAGRWLQMAVPFVFALAWLPSWLTFTQGEAQLALTARPRRTGLDAFLGWSALGVLSLGLYNFLFVGLFHQGTWYYPVSTLWVSLAALRWVDWWSSTAPQEQGASAEELEGPSTRSISWPLVGAALCAGLSLFIFAQLHRVEVREKWSTFYYEEAPKLRAHYQGATGGGPPPALLSYDDGIVAFATGLPTLSGLGFTLDLEGARAFQRKRLFELALKRGHVLLTSLAYFNQELLKRLPRGERNAARRQQTLQRLLRSWPISLSSKQLKGRSFELDYLSADRSLLVIRVSPQP